MGMAAGSNCSSGEEDGDADWKAAIDSVSAVGVSSLNDFAKFNSISGNGGLIGYGHSNQDDEKQKKSPGIKLYQAKAQKLLDDLLDKNIEMVITHIPVNATQQTDGVIRLFSKAPPGMILDPTNEVKAPQKKPKIVPGEEIDEKSKKFKRRIESVAVNGSDIMDAARESCERSLARWKARDAAVKEATKREEERVAELKRIRGEEWLPSSIPREIMRDL